jgi:ATP-binding cassette subfamily B protein
MPRVLARLSQRSEWKFFSVLPKADVGLAAAWWVLLILRGVLPAVFAVAMGGLVAGVQSGAPLGNLLWLVGALFIVQQMLAPMHLSVSYNLGDRTAAWLYDS